MDIVHSIILVIIWVLSSYLGSLVSGSNAALAVGSMILLWVPPQVAKSTFQFWLIGWSLSWIWNFLHSGHIPKKILLGSILTSFIGAYIGASFMTLTPNSILQKITGVIFIIYVPLTLWRNTQIKKYQSTEDRMDSLFHRLLAYLGQLIFSIISGYIPGAAGWLYYIWYSEVLKIKILEYKALWRMTGLAFSLWTLYPIIQAWLLDMRLIIPFLIWAFLWWFLWSKHLIHMWNQVAEKIVLVSVFILWVYLIFS